MGCNLGFIYLPPASVFSQSKCTGLPPEPKHGGRAWPSAGSVDRKLLGECRFSGGVTVLLWQCLQVDELGLLEVTLWSVTKRYLMRSFPLSLVRL